MSTLLDEYRIQIMNQIIGFNPTGQLKLNTDGTIQFMGNISQIYTPQSLQASQLNKTSNNQITNTPQSVTVTENFTNFSREEDKNMDIKKIFYILLVVIFFLIIYLNIKKI
jgi:hypothetical protein